MARFFLVTINFAPEPTGFAPKASALAEHLARRGHDVSVFTGFPFAPEWRRRPKDRGRLWSVTRRERLAVYRITHFIPRTPSSFVQRVVMEASFSASALIAISAALAASARRPDAILYIGAQPAIAMMARLLSALIGRPYFVNITDLAAQAALDVGIVGSRLSRLLESLEFAAYRKAAGAGVLCRAFEEALIQHGYPARRIRLVRDPTDLRLIRPLPRHGAFRDRYDIPSDAFVVMHAGSMGLKQGLMNVIEAADLTRDANVCWVLVGAGEAKETLAAAVRQRRLEQTVRFVPFQPDEAMAAMFADADVLLLNQIEAMKDTVVPSKLLTYMASGRPVLAAVNSTSQAAEIVRDARGGILVPPDSPAALADAVRQFMAQRPDESPNLGARNRAYAEKHFDQEQIVAAHEKHLLTVLGLEPQCPS